MAERSDGCSLPEPPCNSTSTLLAAPNALDSSVISLCQERHRQEEWICFWQLVSDATPAGKQLPWLVDNSITAKHPKPFVWAASARDIREKVTRGPRGPR